MSKKGLILGISIVLLIILGYSGTKIYNYYYRNNKNLTSNHKTNTSSLSQKPAAVTENASSPASESKPAEATPSSPDSSDKATVKITAYKKGDKGDKIVEIQKRLQAYGYKLDIDGSFGNDTFNAIYDFQTRLALHADGIVGPETLEKLQQEPTEKTKYTPPAPAPASNATSHNLLEQYVNENSFNSSTGYFVWIDLASQKVNLFTGSSKNWKLLKSMSCSSGKASTPTVKGNFSIQSKGSYFRVNSNVICKYYSQFYGNYLLHSVLLDNNGNVVDGTLGKPVSHGCVRLAIDDAKYIYDNVPIGTAVLVK